MRTLSGRKQLLFWITAALIPIFVMIAIYNQIRRPPYVRRALYVVGAPERGATLFFGDKQCGVCHSVNGSGGRIAPELSDKRPDTPAMGWIAAVLWNHGPSMWRQIRRKNRPYPELDAQEMADILAFLYEASSVESAGDPVAGQRVFIEKGCVGCHSVGGAGGKTAPELSNISAAGDTSAWTCALLNHAVSMISPISNSLGEWPQFSGNEMKDLVAYVSQSAPHPPTSPRYKAGNAEHGWSVFKDRCMQCHAVRGQGGILGPELGPEKDLPLTTAKFGGVMWNHAPAMLRQGRENGIPVPQLQSNEMGDLLTFLASLRYFEPTGSPLVGERVFSQRGCGACHGNMAQGTQNGPAIKISAEAYTADSLMAALWRHGPHMIDRAEAIGLPWPILKATDIGDLVSFLNAPKDPK